MTDEAGYLQGDLAALGELLGAPLDLIEETLAVMQGFEPCGVFARDLRECLTLQLKELDRCDPAMRSLGVDRLVIDKILNHAEQGVTKVYDRWSADPEKAAAMERWANRLREIISGATPEKIVSMRRIK